MQQYKLTKAELESLTRKIYEEACCGYLDLKDSVCERMVTEFLDDKSPEKEPATAVNVTPATTWVTSGAGQIEIWGAGGAGTSAPPTYGGSGAYFSNPNVSTGVGGPSYAGTWGNAGTTTYSMAITGTTAPVFYTDTAGSDFYVASNGTGNSFTYTPTVSATSNVSLSSNEVVLRADTDLRSEIF